MSVAALEEASVNLNCDGFDGATRWRGQPIGGWPNKPYGRIETGF